MKSSNTPYIIAIIIMATLGALGIVVISLFNPGKDNSLIIASLLGFLTPTTLSLLALMKAQQTHVLVNSRMSEFIDTLKKSAVDKSVIARSEGIIEGRDSENAKNLDTVEKGSKIR